MISAKRAVPASLRVFVDGLVGLGLCVFGELTRQHQFAGALHSPGVHGGALVILDNVARFVGDAVKSVVHEAVHHVHGALAHSDVRMHLLEHLEDVQVERLGALLLVRARRFRASGRRTGRHAGWLKVCEVDFLIGWVAAGLDVLLELGAAHAVQSIVMNNSRVLSRCDHWLVIIKSKMRVSTLVYPV